MNPPHHTVFPNGGLVPADELSRRLALCGREVKVFAGARLVHPERISVGDFTQIDEGVHVFAGEGVRLGRHVHLAFLSSISGGGRCALGDYVGIGAGVRIITGSEVVDGSGLTNPTIPAQYRVVRRGQVTIGPHALVFTNSVVLPDVTIGEGAIVGAASVVHRDLKPWGIFAGNPLRQIGERPPERVLALARELEQAETASTAG